MKSIKYAAMLLSVAIIGGCKSSSNPMEEAQVNDQFAADDANRSVWRVLESQTAAAAAEDGMLYAHHFDGAGLSNLGRDKLDLMLRSEARPLKVYVNVADDAQTSTRQEAVSRFLAAAGLEADAIQVKAGANPAPGAPTAPVLVNSWKIESPGPVAAPQGETSSVVTPPAGVGATAGTNVTKAQ